MSIANFKYISALSGAANDSVSALSDPVSVSALSGPYTGSFSSAFSSAFDVVGGGHFVGRGGILLRGGWGYRILVGVTIYPIGFVRGAKYYWYSAASPTIRHYFYDTQFPDPLFEDYFDGVFTTGGTAIQKCSYWKYTASGRITLSGEAICKSSYYQRTATGGIELGGGYAYNYRYVSVGEIITDGTDPSHVTCRYRVKKGKIWILGHYSGGIAEAHYIAHGSIFLGGLVRPTRKYWVYPTGETLNLDGTAPAHTGYWGNGEIILSGNAIAASSYHVWTGSGGLVIDGRASYYGLGFGKITLSGKAICGRYQFRYRPTGSKITLKGTASKIYSKFYIFDPTGSQITISGAAIVPWDFSYHYAGSGSIYLDSSAIVLRGFIVNSSWNVQGIISKEQSFSWSNKGAVLTEGVLYWWRIVGQCMDIGCDDSGIYIDDGACYGGANLESGKVRYLQTIAAYDLADLCDKLNKQGLVYPLSNWKIKSIHKYLKPVHSDEDYLASDCQTLEEQVDFCSVPECLEYCLLTGNEKVEIGANAVNMGVLWYTGSGLTLLAGTANCYKANERYYTGSGGIVLDGTSEEVTSYNIIVEGNGEVVADGSSYSNPSHHIVAGSGEIVLTGNSDFIAPYQFWNGDGSIALAGVAIIKLFYNYDAVGNLSVGGAAGVILNYVSSGELLGISGTALIVSPWYTFVGSGEATIAGACETNIVVLGEFDAEAGAYSEADYEELIYQDLSIDPIDWTISPTSTTVRCKCGVLPINLYCTHNFNKLAKFSEFLTRNNFSLGNNVTLDYSTINSQWEKSFHFNGYGANQDDIERWFVRFEWGCTNIKDGEYLGTYDWKFSLLLRRTIYSDITSSYVSKMIFNIVDDAKICYTGMLDLDFYFNVLSQTYSNNKGLYIDGHNVDQIGIFASSYWSNNLVKVNLSESIPQIEQGSMSLEPLLPVKPVTIFGR